MKKSWLIAGLLITALAVSGALALMYNLPLDLGERSPRQPIAFSHKLHAGDNAIHCLYCHRSAPTSTAAGIPPVAGCRGCHLFISPEAPEIRKLTGYWDRREQVPWVRVYSLPDHVYFPHKMHVRAGVDCAECHGRVAAMERVERSVSLKMGWCMECHRRKKAGIDCWMCHI